ncbi:peptidyl-tRNA hydrolase [compost metagenome]
MSQENKARMTERQCAACENVFEAPIEERAHTCPACVALVQSGEKPKFNDAKQVILIRKDLQMPAGKLGAQVAHASLACVLKLGTWSSGSVDGMGNISEDEEFTITVANGSPVHDWMTKSFPKITLEVKNEAQLKRYYDEAVAAGLPASWIVDAGRTIFNGVPTPTCVGIGPASREQIDAITKRLRVYQ